MIRVCICRLVSIFNFVLTSRLWRDNRPPIIFWKQASTAGLGPARVNGLKWSRVLIIMIMVNSTVKSGRPCLSRTGNKKPSVQKEYETELAGNKGIDKDEAEETASTQR